MDSYEATKVVYSRIKALDPENASKIMGYLLIQDNGDKEMIRLAFGPETLLQNLIFKAKTHLSNASSYAASPSSFSPSSDPWFPPAASLSYANVVNGASCNNVAASSEYYPSCDEFHHLHGHLSFLDGCSSTADAATPAARNHNHHLLSRSLSVPLSASMCLGSDDDLNSGLGWKHCLYFAKGFCKNGTTCKFHHIHSPDAAAAIVGSPSKLSEFEHCQELLLRSQASVQHRKLATASHFMGSFPYNKCMNFLNDTQRSGALMTGDEFHKSGFMSPSARQIYLTFPADSTFREEDVSNYFSMYGPVHDVRIPYQQKRMFGFVTFVYPETVKLILAKGNPHFVCDSRVLVKPYKEKSKIQEEKKQQQQMERGDYSSACSSPSGPFDFHFGGRMLYSNQEMLRKKLEEQADLQQAIEVQGRRVVNLQLQLKNNNQFHHGLSIGSPIPSPTLSRTPNSQIHMFQFEGTDEEVAAQESSINPSADSQKANRSDDSDGDNQVEMTNSEENDLCDSLEHILPDNLFASPKKSAACHSTFFTSASVEVDEKSMSSTTSTMDTKLPPASPLNMAFFKSCLLQVSRFSSGHEAIGM